ncbi:MAG: hypothetical protein JW384_02842 [Nitrosomonadaceae bacterium]|nr:hypothetical protein [Nitrosomonadaceae bacterium]
MSGQPQEASERLMPVSRIVQAPQEPTRPKVVLNPGLPLYRAITVAAFSHFGPIAPKLVRIKGELSPY